MKFNRRLQKAALAIVASLLLQSLLAGAGAHSASSASVESDSKMDSIASLEPASTGTETLPALRGDEAVSYLKEQQLYPSLAEAMTAARYRIRASESSSPSPRSALSAASYYANNPAQQMTALFTSDGIRLRSKAEAERSKPSRGWQFAMRLRQIGYGDNLLSVTAGAMQVNDNRIEIARRVESRESGVESQIAQRSDSRLRTPDSGLLEWYENRAEGIEQGFRIDAAPGYRREGERLRLRLGVEGELRARRADEGQAVDLVTRAGERALRYDHLKVWDAEGKDLPARMRVEGKSVWLEVEDQGAVYPVTIDPIFSQQAKLTASDGAVNDQFGDSVAISGETAIVGARLGDVGENNVQGSAYVFVRVGATWSEQQKLTASDGADNDNFGFSVAISGETAIVGAPFDNVGTNNFQGSAYVFVRVGATWSQQQKLTASDGAAFDSFGQSVAISGETAIVGAPLDDVGANGNQGSAYVFVRVGATWSQQQKLTASDGATFDFFGFSVAISGETAIVGASLDDVGANADQGSAYVFVRVGTMWSEQQKLTASDGAAGDQFGIAVALSGETAIVGANLGDVGANVDQGSAYVFVRVGATWSEQQKLTASDGAADDRFGQSVALSGETAIVGANLDDVGANADQGSAYVFVRAGTAWSEQQKLTASDGAADDRFGQSVALGGETAIVGAPLDDVGTNTAQGSAYVFACTGGRQWAEQDMVTASDGAANDNFGNSVAISGETAIVGAFQDDVGANNFQGSAYIFVRVGTTWSEQQKLTASDGAAVDLFGFSVAISGETVIVGANLGNVGANTAQGSAYVFVRVGATWSEQQKLTASDGADNDNFGFSVAISGETAIVGARTDDVGANENQGSAYVFVRAGTAWSQQQKLTASDGASGDQFGGSVAISGETAIVGANADDVGANNSQGSAYVFVRAGTAWSQQQKLTASDGADNDNFGGSVAISGETAIVGAAGDDVGANNSQGSAYVFVRAGTAWSQQQKLTASDGAAIDNFGFSVALSGETAIVGALLDDVGANADQGSAYVFVRVGTTWSEQQKLTASDGAANDRFGNSVAISGETVIVGAVLDDVGANVDQGSAYIFINECLPNTPPSISTSPVSVLRCNSLTGAAIATVSDVEDAASALVVTVVSGGSASGITLSNISNLNGAITATVAASPTATSGTVRLRVTDLGGSTSEADLQVTVLSPPPVINCPPNQTAVTAAANGASVAVNYPPPTVSDNCPGTTVVCSPPSGSLFPTGVTTVTCTASDTSGGQSSCSFTVTVFNACLQDNSSASSVLLFNTTTGDYRFCCGGTIYTGKGSVVKQGGTYTLTHNTTTRRVLAKLDTAQKKGTATLQEPIGVMKCSITDSNTLNNTCLCN
jgi:hypothetical protein